MSDERISYLPTDGLSYDPGEEVYWDADALDREITRVFEVCHGCRMCFKFCDTFPDLFELIDNKYDGDVRNVDQPERVRLMAECFQCKLCEVQCPYTPADGHEFQLDFPRLVHRFRAVHSRDGRSLRDRVLGDPDGTAKLARSSLGVANVMNRVGAHRWFLEKVLGIHRDKLLPQFATLTFEAWAEGEGLMRGVGGEAVLFQTCYVQHNEPQVGKDTVDVLQRNDVDVRCAQGFRCCGMPAWESGDLDGLRERASHNLELLTPYVEAGAKVVVINPTCSMMMRREWPELLAGLDQERARVVADAVTDAGEFLWSIRKQPRFNTEFRSTPNGPVAYHAPCHLRAQRVGFKGRDLLGKIPGVTASTTMECCGHDGTYAMKTEGFVPSQKVGKRAFEDMKDQGAEIWATDCPLAALQFQQHAGRRPMHPMTILARAYRPDGFPTRIEPESDVDEEATL